MPLPAGDGGEKGIGEKEQDGEGEGKRVATPELDAAVRRAGREGAPAASSHRVGALEGVLHRPGDEDVREADLGVSTARLAAGRRACGIRGADRLPPTSELRDELHRHRDHERDRGEGAGAELEEIKDVSKIIADDRTNSIIVLASKRAIDKGVAFVPGMPFFSQNPDAATLRLSFATADVAKIREGVARLGQALKG